MTNEEPQGLMREHGDLPTVDTLNLDLCIVRTRRGERISDTLAALLDPIDPATLHEWVLPARAEVELHRHDFDEYWWFTSGEPRVALWTESSGMRQYRVQAGDLVACLRGVAHTLQADHALRYYQFSSMRRPGAREGHLPVGQSGVGAWPSPRSH